jgi:hypothetical protein
MEAELKSLALIVLVTLAGLQSGCSRPQSSPPDTRHGRYSGIGIYPAGQGWWKLAEAAPPASGGEVRARLADDEQVIVVVDSQTGEVRQCGNLSGHCIGMSPWARELGAAQTAPVGLASSVGRAP